MRTGALDIQVDDNVRRPHVVLRGEMDATSEEAGHYLVERMRVSPDATWRIDMSEISFVDSSGLRSLLVARRSLGPEGTIVVVQPSPPVRALLRMSRLDYFFAIDESPLTAA